MNTPFLSAAIKPPSTPKILIAFTLNNVGTGGCNTPNLLRSGVYTFQKNSNAVITEHKSVRSPKQNLDLIRQYMQLSIVDLSFIFNVTRPTIYSWLEDVEPKSETSRHIQAISNLAEQLQNYKIANIGKLLHRPIINGRSLLEKIKTDENLDESWTLFKNFLSTELKNRSIQKGSGSYSDSKKTINQHSTLAFKE